MMRNGQVGDNPVPNLHAFSQPGLGGYLLLGDDPQERGFWIRVQRRGGRFDPLLSCKILAGASSLIQKSPHAAFFNSSFLAI
jgi:hypothetical protein